VIAFWLALSPLVRKLILYGALALAALYALRLWGNRQWSAGEQAGRQAGLAEAEKAMAERQAELAKGIADERQQLAKDKAEIAVQATQVAQARQDIQGALSAVVRASQARRNQNNAVVDRLSGDALDAAIRAQSNLLAAAPAN